MDQERDVVLVGIGLYQATKRDTEEREGQEANDYPNNEAYH